MEPVIESAFSWLSQLVQFLGSLIPRLLVVQWSHRAVKYRNGYDRILLEPGRHLYWPIMSPIEICAVVRQTLDVPTRALETADGHAVVASGVVEYEIVDAVTFLSESENGYDSIRLVAGAALWRSVRQSTLEELREDGESMQRLLVAEMQEDLAPYGVKVLTTQYGDLAETSPMHLTGAAGGSEHVAAVIA